MHVYLQIVKLNLISQLVANGAISTVLLRQAFCNNSEEQYREQR